MVLYNKRITKNYVSVFPAFTCEGPNTSSLANIKNALGFRFPVSNFYPFVMSNDQSLFPKYQAIGCCNIPNNSDVRDVLSWNYF